MSLHPHRHYRPLRDGNAELREGGEMSHVETKQQMEPFLEGTSTQYPIEEEEIDRVDCGAGPSEWKTTTVAIGDLPRRPPGHGEGGTPEVVVVEERRGPSPDSSSTEKYSKRMGVRLENWEIGKVAFLLSYLVLAGLSNWAVLAWTHDFIGRESLPDLVFSFISEQPWAAGVGDGLVTVSILCLVALVAFHKHRVVICRRVVFIAATLYAMRSVTLISTQLPPGYSNSRQRCREQSLFSWGVFFSRWGEQTVRIGFQGSSEMLCGDMLFSGHSLVMMVCSLTVCHYLPSKLKWLGVFPSIFAYFGMLCMIISRTHYTIDVVIAFWLSNLIFYAYHAYAEADLFMDRKQSAFHSITYFRLVEWLEENVVPGRVDNVFVNPVHQLMESVQRKRTEHGGHHKQVSVSSSSTFALPA